MPADPQTLLYDSGHPHWLVRYFAAGIAFIAGGIFLDTLAMSLPCGSLLHAQTPAWQPIGLVAALVLFWFCTLCAIGRNRIFFDPAANCIIQRGPGLAFRQRDICYNTCQIKAVKVRHLHAGIGTHGWDVELVKADGRRRWLTRFSQDEEAAARELAEKISGAVRKPIE